MVGDYLAIQTALAEDSIDGVKSHAEAIAKASHGLSEKFDLEVSGVEKTNEEAMLAILPDLNKTALALSKAKDLVAARTSFGALSDAMIAYRELVAGEAPNVAYCPMAKQSWLQSGKEIANPYYGSKMLRCGSIVSK